MSNHDSGDGVSPSRRSFMKGIGVAGAAGVSQTAAADSGNPLAHLEDPPNPEDNPRLFADKVLLKGKIVTLDDHEMTSDPGTVGEAMAIKDGHVLDVGSSQRISKWQGPDTEVIDLDGQTVLPGFVESHIHPSNTLEDVAEETLTVPGVHMALRAEKTPEETLAKMQEYVDRVDPSEEEWLFMNVEPNPDIPEVDSVIKLTRWTKRDDPDDLKITKDDINNLADGNPMLAAVSGGRTPSIAEPGEILRVERSEGELRQTVIWSDSQ